MEVLHFRSVALIKLESGQQRQDEIGKKVLRDMPEFVQRASRSLDHS